MSSTAPILIGPLAVVSPPEPPVSSDSAQAVETSASALIATAEVMERTMRDMPGLLTAGLALHDAVFYIRTTGSNIERD